MTTDKKFSRERAAARAMRDADGGLSLMQAQDAVARERGFAHWADMTRSAPRPTVTPVVARASHDEGVSSRTGGETIDLLADRFVPVDPEARSRHLDAVSRILATRSAASRFEPHLSLPLMQSYVASFDGRDRQAMTHEGFISYVASLRGRSIDLFQRHVDEAGKTGGTVTMSVDREFGRLLSEDLIGRSLSESVPSGGFGLVDVDRIVTVATHATRSTMIDIARMDDWESFLREGLSGRARHALLMRPFRAIAASRHEFDMARRLLAIIEDRWHTDPASVSSPPEAMYRVGMNVGGDFGLALCGFVGASALTWDDVGSLFVVAGELYYVAGAESGPAMMSERFLADPTRHSDKTHHVVLFDWMVDSFAKIDSAGKPFSFNPLDRLRGGALPVGMTLAGMAGMGEEVAMVIGCTIEVMVGSHDNGADLSDLTIGHGGRFTPSLPLVLDVLRRHRTDIGQIELFGKINNVWLLDEPFDASTLQPHVEDAIRALLAFDNPALRLASLPRQAMGKAA